MSKPPSKAPLRAPKNSVASCSPDQTHIEKSPEWPLAITLLNIEVLTRSLNQTKKNENMELHVPTMPGALTFMKLQRNLHNETLNIEQA
jgi:hypothetical protein